jgi:hypothetical protein
MGTRGRSSAAEMAIAPVTPMGSVARQKPPSELTDEEVEIWASVVASEPADWFSASTVPLLAQYCRHVISAKRIAELIERHTGDANLAIADYDKLLHMQDRESRVIVTLATKMRIAQQSTTNHRGNKKPTQARKLWES